MNFSVLRVIVLFSAFILVSCQTVSYDKPLSENLNEATDLERTWLYAKVRIPAKYTRSGKEERFPFWDNPVGWKSKVESVLASPEGGHPVAVYLHGCEGLNASNQLFVDFLSNSSWLVFAPDSFARPDRDIQCYSQGGTFTYQYRLQEARYALEKLQEAGWVDQNRLVLVGHSEGGEAAGQWSYPGYAAIIISGANCGRSGGGVYAPLSVPVLSILGSNDPKEDAPCSIAGRPASSKSVTIPGAGHSVYLHANGEREMTRFLDMCCSR